jgi:hypothetical protein
MYRGFVQEKGKLGDGVLCLFPAWCHGYSVSAAFTTLLFLEHPSVNKGNKHLQLRVVQLK